MDKLRHTLIYLFILLSSFSLNPHQLSSLEPTSTADTEEYRKFCVRACEDEGVFQNFKIYPIYQRYSEPVSYEMGRSYLRIIKDKYPGLLIHMDVFQTNDLLGNPALHEYDIGYFSPTTLRYIKVAGDIINLFPDLNNKKVIEIGGGYGGQCKILSDIFSFQEYTIVDLPEPLALTKKYLEILNVPNVRYLTPDQVKQEKYDLVISNYSFSRCNHTLQSDYLNNVIQHSRFGYMTLDFLPFPFHDKPYAVSELVSFLIKNPSINVRIYPEDPLTSPKNVIFTWRKK